MVQTFSNARPSFCPGRFLLWSFYALIFMRFECCQGQGDRHREKLCFRTTRLGFFNVLQNFTGCVQKARRLTFVFFTGIFTNFDASFVKGKQAMRPQRCPIKVCFCGLFFKKIQFLFSIRNKRKYSKNVVKCKIAPKEIFKYLSFCSPCAFLKDLL